jgi:hypothetical protein
VLRVLRAKARLDGRVHLRQIARTAVPRGPPPMDCVRECAAQKAAHRRDQRRVVRRVLRSCQSRSGPQPRCGPEMTVIPIVASRASSERRPTHPERELVHRPVLRDFCGTSVCTLMRCGARLWSVGALSL